jgi:predicted MPP superfamily phosphohydrolase
VALRVARFVVPVVVGLAGATLAMVAFGHETVAMGPFRVQLAAGFGRGVTDIALPPLGRLTADTHRAPLRVSATLQSVNVTELTSDVGHRGLDSIIDDVERRALGRIVPFAARLFLVAMGGATALSLIAFRLKVRPIALALATTLVAVGGSETAAWATYRPSALLTPTFSGSLALAPKLIGPAQTAIHRIDDFRAELSNVLGGAVRVYTSLEASPLTAAQEIRVLHISDVHLSPLGMTFASEVARAFNVAFVVDTGDITSFGTPAENLILSAIPTFGRPYVYVRGNHDSIALQEAVARVPGAVVLDDRTKRINGLTVYGLGDPIFTPNKLTLQTDEQLAGIVRSAGDRVVAGVRRTAEPPDIVAVHDDRMAEAAAGFVPLVISGHFHKQSARVMGGTLFLRDGSTGGAGANVFTEQGGIPLEAEVLYFPRTAPRRLVAYDLIQQSPESGSLTVKRHLVEQQFGTLVPNPPPPTRSPADDGALSPQTVFTPSPS